MTPAYVLALGGTEKIKHFLDWIEAQHMLADEVRRKQEEGDANAIGDDLDDHTEES